jgi:adenine-specific DNA-methyltransferase
VVLAIARPYKLFTDGPEDEHLSIKEVESRRVVLPDDPEFFIHVVSDEIGSQIARKMSLLKSKLKDLGIDVSTGKIVDFRCKEFLTHEPSSETVPLIHPANLTNNFVAFPLPKNRKPSFFKVTQASKSLLIPNDNYVLTKRFSTNEEKKRIVAAVYESERFDYSLVGLENRVNYFHHDGKGLDINITKGLALFLNSTLVDFFFRQFNGHTQVNATDLRNLNYPTYTELKTLGGYVSDSFPSQNEIDEIIEKELVNTNSI